MPKNTAKSGGRGGITHRQARLVKLLADPSWAGKSSADIAAELGISARTVRSWWAKPEIKDEVQKLVWQYAGRHLPYAWECLVKRMGADTKAIQLYFTLIGQYHEQIALTGAGGGPIRLAALAAYSEADLARIRDELAGS